MFGGSGMVGQGALRECLRDPEVEQVASVVRAPTGATQQKLREIAHRDFLNFTPIENELAGLNACLYCLGVTSTGTTEENYTRITYEFAIAAATTLLKMNPGMSFVFVSGKGADSTEQKGREREEQSLYIAQAGAQEVSIPKTNFSEPTIPQPEPAKKSRRIFNPSGAHSF